VAHASVFLARHLKNPVFSTSLSIPPSGRRRCLVSTDVVLASLFRLLIAIPLHMSSCTASQNDPRFGVAPQLQSSVPCPRIVRSSLGYR